MARTGILRKKRKKTHNPPPRGGRSLQRILAVGTPSITAPGAPTARDEAMFMADPRGFCAARISEVGPVFATGAFGGAVFVGGAEAVNVCRSDVSLCTSHRS